MEINIDSQSLALRLLRPADYALVVCCCFMLIGTLAGLGGGRYLQVPLDVLLAADKRRPVLFLRSFADDEKLQLKKADDSILDFSLETRLSKHFRHFGPFIGVGSPAERVPQLGAARAALSDSEWQSKVRQWILQSALIIMYAGKTRWVNWELANIIEAGQTPRLILMIPELKESGGKIDEEITFRLERVRLAFKDTMWSESLAGLRDLEDIRSITFRGDGSIAVVKSRFRNRDSSHLAFLVAHHITLNQAAA